MLNKILKHTYIVITILALFIYLDFSLAYPLFDNIVSLIILLLVLLICEKKLKLPLHIYWLAPLSIIIFATAPKKFNIFQFFTYFGLLFYYLKINKINIFDKTRELIQNIKTKSVHEDVQNTRSIIQNIKINEKKSSLMRMGMILKKLPIIKSLYKWAKGEGFEYSLLLLAIILLGGFLALYNLGNLGFIVDEIYNAMMAKNIMKEGVPLAYNGDYYMRGLSVSYLGALFNTIFPSPEFSLRLVSALSYIAIIPILYSLGKLILNKNTGLLAAFIWTLSPWALEIGRWGRMYSMMALLFVSFFYFLLLHAKYKNKKDLIYVVLIIFLGLITHQLTFLLLLIFILYSVIEILHIFFTKKIKHKKVLITIIAIIFILFFIFLYYTLKIAGYSKDGFLLPISYVYNTAISMRKYDPFFIIFYKRYLPLLYVGLIGFIIYFVFAIKDKINFKKNLILLMAGPLSIIFVANYHLQLAYRYLFPTLPMVILIFSFVIVIIYESIKNKFKLNKILLVLAFLFIGTIYFQFYYTFTIPFRNYYDESPLPHFAPTTVNLNYPNLKDEMLFVKQNKKPKDLLITNKYKFFNFYTNQDADYHLAPLDELDEPDGSDGSDFLLNDIEKKVLWGGETKMITSYQYLIEIIEKYEGDTVWFAFNFTGDHYFNVDIIKEILKKLNNRYMMDIAFKDKSDPGALVYKLTKTFNVKK